MADDGFYESREWLDLRYRVLKKHNGCCQLCGTRGTESNPIHVDHIKPRSKHPELQLAESNMQLLCKACNMGKSNKDKTDWRWAASKGLTAGLNRKAAVVASADPLRKAKLEQLAWLKQNDVDPYTRKAAEKEYLALWKEVEADWIARGGE